MPGSDIPSSKPSSAPGDTPVRINRYIASSGMCSRRAADKLIEAGCITINGKVAALGDTVSEGDLVEFEGHPVTSIRRKIYIMFNKPRGVTCTASPEDPDNIIDYIGYPERLFTIGRLDKDSEGLILLTNDGDTANLLLRTDGKHEKEYVVTVDKPITEDFLKKMSSGIYLPELDKTTIPCVIGRNGKKSFRIWLTQGLNRQIRRMCYALGYRVVKLKRVAFATVELGDLPVGKYRELTDEEIAELKGVTGN